MNAGKHIRNYLANREERKHIQGAKVGKTTIVLDGRVGTGTNDGLKEYLMGV